MNHEPECPWRFEDDCHVVAAGVTFCEVARAAYQRGREDAAKAVAFMKGAVPQPVQWEDVLAIAIAAARGETCNCSCHPEAALCCLRCMKAHNISAARGDGEQE